MDPIARQACLREIGQLWSAAYQRPDMAWIGEHKSVSPDCDRAVTDVVKAWLLTDRALEQRAAHDFVRFLAVHSGGLWSSGTLGPPASGVFNNRPGAGHTIGMASFAPIEGSELIYLEFVWGGRNGRGARYRLDPSSALLECVENVWLA